MAAAAPACSIRTARACDDGPVVALGAQLGYAIEAAALEAMRSRADPEQALLVAEAAGAVVGWAQVSVRRVLIHPPHAEIEGLVVDDSARGQGAGQALLRAAEAWARGHGLSVVRLRCSIRREAAHAFYERNGYRLHATSHQFVRDLGR